MLYTTAHQLTTMISGYFKHLDGLFHLEKVPAKGIKTEATEQKIWDKEPEPATMSGLALYLGFNSRKDFDDYEANGQFADLLRQACLRIEAEYEKKLHQQSSGVMFALKRMGWVDKESETDAAGQVHLMQVQVITSGPEPAGSEHEVKI